MSKGMSGSVGGPVVFTRPTTCGPTKQYTNEWLGKVRYSSSVCMRVITNFVVWLCHPMSHMHRTAQGVRGTRTAGQLHLIA